MGNYIHEQAAWPAFTWDYSKIAGPLAEVRYQQGRFQGKLDTLSHQPKSLGMYRGWPAFDMTNYNEPLTREQLLEWHTALFPSNLGSDYGEMRIGSWRDDSSGAMQLISTIHGNEHIHYEAPAAHRIDEEIAAFLEWFNIDRAVDPVLKAGIAHLWFATLYPFDDGNGRIAAAITDRQLARAEQNPNRLYDVSGQIADDQHAYYQILEQTQKGNLDITPWLQWFIAKLDQAITLAEAHLSAILQKTVPYENQQSISLSERQRLILSKLTDELEGHLTSSKWAELAHCSPDTALRDIHDLMNKGILEKEERGGRSTSYRMKP